MKSGKIYLHNWKEDWQRAKDFLKAAEANLNLGDFKTSANRSYFTAESAVIASLKLSSKPVSKNHKNIWELSNLLEVGINTHDLLRELYDLRMQADYGYMSSEKILDKETVSAYLLKVKELLNAIKKKYKLD